MKKVLIVAGISVFVIILLLALYIVRGLTRFPLNVVFHDTITYEQAQDILKSYELKPTSHSATEQNFNDSHSLSVSVCKTKIFEWSERLKENLGIRYAAAPPAPPEVFSNAPNFCL